MSVKITLQFKVNLTLSYGYAVGRETGLVRRCGVGTWSWTGPITLATTARRILLIPSLSLSPHTQPSRSPPHSRTHTHTHTPQRAAAAAGDTGSIIPSLTSGLPSLSIFLINKK